MADRPRLYVDSNVFILALEADGDAADQCRSLLSAFRTGALTGMTSELTLAEVLVGPARTRDSDLKRAYIALFRTGRSIVDLRPVSRDVLVESVEYRARLQPDKPALGETKRNFLPDAIHVVTAISQRATHFASRDMRLRLPSSMARLVPGSEGFDSMARMAR